MLANADRHRDCQSGAGQVCKILDQEAVRPHKVLLDTTHYQKGIKVSDAEMARLNIRGGKFHPEWNYTIRPHQQPP